MAWAMEEYRLKGLSVRLGEDYAEMSGHGHSRSREETPRGVIEFSPLTSDDAHKQALMLRKLARHLEMLGKKMREVGW